MCVEPKGQCVVVGPPVWTNVCSGLKSCDDVFVLCVFVCVFVHQYFMCVAL